MSSGYALAADHGDVFAHFRAERVPERSVYLYSPVFPCQIAGRPAVIKRTRRTPEDAAAVAAATRQWLAGGVAVVTPLEIGMDNPMRLGDVHWVAYPFIDGGTYSGQLAEIEAAGTLLGRMHARDAGPARLPVFRWPDYDQARVDEDVELLAEVMTPHVPPQAVEHLSKLQASFTVGPLPVIRDAGLPLANSCMDYKASNLVYTQSGPVLVDPDNGDFAPRLLDLAQAALLFHTDHAAAPTRPFDRAEWATFVGAYLREADLTERERALWPAAIEYMMCEEGHWAFTGTPEEWNDPCQRSFLLALAITQPDDFPLS